MRFFPILLTLVVLGLDGTLPAAADAGRGTAPQKVVAITQIVEHPALDSCRKGVAEALAERGYGEGAGVRYLYETAQGNVTTAVQIARRFVGEAPAVVVAISTPSAQAMAAATRDIPIVFSAVTDPVAAKLVADLAKPGGNVTGVSDRLPVTEHLGLIKGVLPELTALGVLFNPGEANSVALVDTIRRVAPGMGLAVVEAAAPQSGAVLAAARSLVGKVGAIYVPTDNTVVSALEAVIKVGIDARLPVFAGDTDSVARGAVAALGFDYRDVGRETGHMVADILEGRSPGEMAVRTVTRRQLHVNPASAERMGTPLPAALLAGADRVIR